MKKLNFCFFLLFLCVIVNYGQDFAGRVSDIKDGRTLMIKLGSGEEIRVQMLYIEVPEPAQPLSEVVRDHLARLVLNKTVQFYSEREYSQGYLGVLKLGDVDIAQQMLRDGAAWFDLPVYGDFLWRDKYQKMETLARAEKRGVWGVAGLVPAWQFREEEYEKRIDARRAVREQNMSGAPVSEIGWMNFGVGGPTGNGPNFDTLRLSYDKYNDETHISSYEIPVSVTGGSPDNTLQLRVDEYFRGQDFQTATGRRYLLTFHATGRKLPDLSQLRLTGGAKKAFTLKSLAKSPVKDIGNSTDLNDDVEKVYTFELSQLQFSELVSFSKVEFLLGNWKGSFPDNFFNDLP